MQVLHNCCRQAGPEHEFDAKTGCTIHVIGPERERGELSGHTLCGEVSNEVFGSGTVNDAAGERASQLASHQQH